MSKTLKFIGISGVIGAGKDSIGDYLASLAHDIAPDFLVYPISFGGLLKRSCICTFGGSMNNYYGSNQEKEAETPFWRERLGEKYSSFRRIMQSIGSVYREHIHENIWIYFLEQLIFEVLLKDLKAEKILFIVTDVRYNNEAEWVKNKLNGRIIRIEAPTLATTEEIRQHSSEAGISPMYIDLLLDNGSKDGFDKFKEPIIDLLEDLGIGLANKS